MYLYRNWILFLTLSIAGLNYVGSVAAKQTNQTNDSANISNKGPSLIAKTREAAEKGNPKAQFAFGQAYFYGVGVKQNYIEAVKWFTKAAEQGHPEA